MAVILTYFHTLRHLRLIQIVERLRRRVRKLSVVLDDPVVELRSQNGGWVDCNIQKQSLFENGSAEFLNCKCVSIDWFDAKQGKLWLYNLHYFDDLVAVNANDRKHLHGRIIQQWIDENPVMVGNGWEPYPLSLRIVNWVKWVLNGNEPSSEMLASLKLQAHILLQSLEYHLLGNHLFVNAKALVFFGTYSSGEFAERCLAKGLKLVDKELKEQILGDGGNFELSPMYHSLMTLDLLDLVNLTSAYDHRIFSGMTESWRGVAGKMLEWLRLMRHPDGELVFFNDTAIDVAPSPERLFSYADKLGVKTTSQTEEPSAGWRLLPESGYIKIIQESSSVAFLDVARIGPDYIPGHAHADTLSFEWSFRKQRVFVNSGTSCYGVGAERLRQRKTAAHNTVEVDGEDSSEVWSGFRVARRAYPSKPTVEKIGNCITVSCSHNGYKRLPGKVTHWRTWEFKEGGFSVLDRLDGKYKSALGHFHLHPDVQVEWNGGQYLELILKGVGQVEVKVSIGELSVIDSTWHPEFGISIPNKKLCILLENGKSNVSVNW